MRSIKGRGGDDMETRHGISARGPLAWRKGGLLLGLACLLTATRGGAGEAWKLPPEKVVLKPGPGRELVLGQCVACHSEIGRAHV